MRKLHALFLVAAGALALVACDDSTVYCQYRHTPLVGWEKNDTLFYVVAPIKSTGRYHEDVGLRVSNRYPFMSVSLIVEQKILPRGIARRDTINCMLTNNKGSMQGPGYTFFQYLEPLSDISLNEGDSLCIYIRHGMRREIISGIQDVGVKIGKAF